MAKIITLLLIFVLFVQGCSLANVTEVYERSGPDITSRGQGYKEFYLYETGDGVIHLFPSNPPPDSNTGGK